MAKSLIAELFSSFSLIIILFGVSCFACGFYLDWEISKQFPEMLSKSQSIKNEHQNILSKFDSLREDANFEQVLLIGSGITLNDFLQDRSNRIDITKYEALVKHLSRTIGKERILMEENDKFLEKIAKTQGEVIRYVHFSESSNELKRLGFVFIVIGFCMVYLERRKKN